MSNINVMRKNLGPVTAYKYAVSKGFTGTEEEFAELMASYASIAQDVSAESRVAEGYALGKQNGVDVGDQSPYYHANAKYHAEQAAAKAQEAAESAAQAEGAIEVDETLSVKGRAADAAKVGELKRALGADITVTCTDGYFINTAGNQEGSENSCATNFISVVPGEKIKFGNLKLTGTRSIVAYDSNKEKLSVILSGSGATEYTATMPDNAAYVRATGSSGTNVTAMIIDLSNTVIGAAIKVIGLDDRVSGIDTAIGTYIPTITKIDGKCINAAGNEEAAANSCATDFIPVVLGQQIYISGLKLTSTRSVCGYSRNKTFLSRIAGNTSETTLTYTVPDGIYFIRATGESGVAPKLYYNNLIGAVIAQGSKVTSDSAFVSPNGNDTTGDGSASNPFATVDKALKSGASNIYLASGVYDETIDLASSPKTNIKIINASKDGKVVFKRSGAVITESETQVPGYANVYSASTTKTFNDNNLWIYQDCVADAGTKITAAERHPAQKGRQYRCADTKIVKCDSTTLSDALSEIENSENYKWFVNSGTIYFSRPSAVSTSNPICADFGFVLFANAQQYHSVEIYGIDAKYMCINLNNMKNAKAVDCSALNVYHAGAFTYNSRNTCLIRCEAGRCVNGVNGDGFNGAASLTGDADAKQTVTELVDCWSHDNNDDGYSDHNRSDAVMRGGLYEYNKKAGVTPSSGENFAAYGVVSRKNIRGFFLTSDISDGSKVLSATLFDCVADNNTGGDTSNGFSINSSNGSMTLFNCMAMNSPFGYRAENTAYLKLIDCRAYGVTTAKAGNGTIEVINGTAVS